MADTHVASSAPMSGSVPAAIGAPTVIRIPIPGSNRLAIEFWPRNYAGKSTSVLFFQDAAGKRVLRLDYGYNPKTKTVDYHWNQKGTFEAFGVVDHTPAGMAGELLYKGAQYYRFAGRAFLVIGIGMDAYSIMVSSQPLRQGIKVISGWGAGLVTGEALGAGGAEVGLLAGPIGSAVLGTVGGAVGFFIGYESASAVSAKVYDWADGTFFTKLPAVPGP